MTTHPPTPTKEFEAALRYLGWGDPSRGVWFMGLEESDYWAKDQVHQYLSLPPVKPATTELDFAALGRKGARIREVTSRILSTVSAGAREQPQAERSRWYLNTRMWRPGSGAFQGNLYPLGKRAVDDWPKDFEELFGFGAEHRDAYMRTVAATRFPLIRELWTGSRPQATVCFGKIGWPDFRAVFKLGEPSRTISAGRIEVYGAPMRVILTPFFTRAMTNADASAVGDFLRDEWRVSIP